MQVKIKFKCGFKYIFSQFVLNFYLFYKGKMETETLKANRGCCQWTPIPCHIVEDWLNCNKYLLNGHRPQINSFRGCLASIFRIHTDTGNIWSHLLGKAIDWKYENVQKVLVFCKTEVRILWFEFDFFVWCRRNIFYATCNSHVCRFRTYQANAR